MDHYPSYLLKWQPSQLQRLRDALSQQIALVDAAAAAVSLSQQQLLSYTPLAPPITQQDVLSWVNPAILSAARAPRDRVLPLLLRAAVDELGDGSVWTFDLLTRDGDTPCAARDARRVTRLLSQASTVSSRRPRTTARGRARGRSRGTTRASTAAMCPSPPLAWTLCKTPC
jgi:hypothetical protein